MSRHSSDISIRQAQANGTAAAAAVSVTGNAGKITTEALTTAGLAAYTLTITNPNFTASDIVLNNVANGTNTQGTITVGRVTPAAGSCVILIQNTHATQALNGTLVVGFLIVHAPQ